MKRKPLSPWWFVLAPAAAGVALIAVAIWVKPMHMHGAFPDLRLFLSGFVCLVAAAVMSLGVVIYKMIQRLGKGDDDGDA